MCVAVDPYIVAEGIKLIKDVVTTVFAVQEMKNQKAEYKYNVQLLTSQAKEQEARAAEVRQEGIEQARRQRLNAILNASEQQSTIAASNLGLSSQMSLNLKEDAKLNGELEALTTLKNSEKTAEAYIDAANNYYYKAELNASKAKHSYLSYYTNRMKKMKIKEDNDGSFILSA